MLGFFSPGEDHGGERRGDARCRSSTIVADGDAPVSPTAGEGSQSSLRMNGCGKPGDA